MHKLHAQRLNPGSDIQFNTNCFDSVRSQAKDALNHPYFDDLDKATVDLLESEEIRERDAEN